MTKTTNAVILLIITAILWSTGGVLIKYVSWNPLAIAGMRSAIASLIMIAVVGKPRITWSKVQMGGAIAYMATVVLFVTATKLTSAANAILLQYTGPIYVALFGRWFLGERTTRLDWITIGVVLGGMTLFFMDSLSSDGMLGNIIAIASGVAFAWLALFLRKQKNERPEDSIILGNWMATVIALPFMLTGGMPSGNSWIGLILLGVVQLGISYILYARAIRHVTALEALLIPVVEPILNPIWALLLLSEKPGSWAIIGGIIVLGAITLRGVIVLNHQQKPALR
ncbi:MAG: EamA family transporter [Ignavibacteriae bacterium]|nr:EamA family transporter [Ignavibacteriota bacterium]